MTKQPYFLLTMILVLACGTTMFANEPTTKSAVTTKSVVTAKPPVPHCEVPCGIYADQMRFEQMLEDTATISKAIDNIIAFSTEMKDGAATPKGINQVARWVTTKEDHATNTQHIVAQYFLTQRIKSDNANYQKQLAAAHSVVVGAMKCKQDANVDTAKALKAAILDLYRAYEGKEPAFHEKK